MMKPGVYPRRRKTRRSGITDAATRRPTPHGPRGARVGRAHLRQRAFLRIHQKNTAPRGDSGRCKIIRESYQDNQKNACRLIREATALFMSLGTLMRATYWRLVVA